MRKVSLLLVIVLLIAAAAPAYAAPHERATKIKLGLLPTLDSLPIFVAQQAGYFEEAGIEVETIPVTGVLERDQVLIAGEVDGILTDVIGAGIFNQDEVRAQIVSTGKVAYLDYPQFRILAAPGSDIASPDDLKGVEIGISENSVIHYMVQRILENAGLSADDIEIRSEPNIAVRFQLLMEGQLKAACLPDPLGQAAIEGGAILVIDDSTLPNTNISQSVFMFSKDAIEDKPEAVQAFLWGWNRAAADINADPEAFRALWIEKTNVPDSVKDTYVIPPFPLYTITDQAVWDDVMAWMVDQDIIDEAPAYEDGVNPVFLDAIRPAEASEAPSGDADSGKALFDQNCVACHSVGDMTGVGPALAGLAGRAGSTVDGLNAVDYLRQSIVEPGAYVVEGFSNIMPPYAMLTDGEVNDLIAYLMTLE
jgi:NitT/TauT family transport system substrate-binding protein